MRQGRLRARDRARSRPRARLLRTCDRIAPDPRRPVFSRLGDPARSSAGRRGPDGSRDSAFAGGPWPKSRSCPSIAPAPRPFGAVRNCCFAAPPRPRGAPMPSALERRSPSASSRTAILSRPGCSTCADRASAHFHASNAFSSIAWPSGDFWNTTLAMRSSLSSSGKSNQERVCIRSRLRAVSASPFASAIRK